MADRSVDACNLYEIDDKSQTSGNTTTDLNTKAEASTTRVKRNLSLLVQNIQAQFHESRANISDTQRLENTQNSLET